MDIWFEDDGTLQAASIVEDIEGGVLIDLRNKRRVKLRSERVLFEFAATEEQSHEALRQAAVALAQTLDVGFLWECAGEEEFSFVDLAQAYVGHPPSAVEAGAIWLRLSEDTGHFLKRGGKRFVRGTQDDIAQAAVRAAKRAALGEQQTSWVDALLAGTLPKEIAAKLPGLLYHFEPGSAEGKAVQLAAQKKKTSPIAVLIECGAVRDEGAYRMERFVRAHYPTGRGFATVPPFDPPPPLPCADVQAFSIDDVNTTEVDDAFSVTDKHNGTYEIGIHIAAPALGFLPGSAMDELARARLSTVYVPGDKITMLPKPVIEAYSLQEGRNCPVLSLYVTVASDGSHRILGTHTRIEEVPIVKNLRFPPLDDVLTAEVIARGDGDLPFAKELCVLHGLATRLFDERAKGEFENIDFLYFLDPIAGQPDRERIRIQPRLRSAPADRIVSELMIFVNSEWGKLLGERDMRALFRVQDGGRVRLSLYAGPHLALGVDQYAWSSSPLRRYVDLVNQWLLLAIVYGEGSPYEGKDSELLAIAREFDQTLSSIDEFQKSMERYYALRYLLQENITETTAVVARDKDSLVRLERVPLWQRLPGMPSLPPGTVVRVAISRIDVMDLSFHCNYLP
jgi:exoribonuclease-2